MPKRGSGRNLTGSRFGHLVVIEEAPKKESSRARRWLCRCDCGGETIVLMGNLERGRTKSCQCSFLNEAIGATFVTHGHTRRKQSKRTREYSAWSSMWTRCTNPNNAMYSNYGGRGISIAPEWRSFEQFLSDMGPKPTPDHSLDRIDVNSDYAPENCRWATSSEQAINKQNSVWLTLDGETLHISEWAKQTGIGKGTISFRIRNGWSVKDALTRPAKTPRKIGPTFITLNGATHTIAEWSAITGIKRTTIGMRLSRGWSAERVLSP